MAVALSMLVPVMAYWLLAEAGYNDVSAHEMEGSDLSSIKGIAKAIYQYSDYSAIPSSKFDAVTLLDVVEHVVDPRYLLRMCCRILKPDGILYFHTPVVTNTVDLCIFCRKFQFAKRLGLFGSKEELLSFICKFLLRKPSDPFCRTPDILTSG
jgi:2-polyprenyl-3-methyl-5-hydroxy-6-metoxy-1,4-benzoquinol methylase